MEQREHVIDQLLRVIRECVSEFLTTEDIAAVREDFERLLLQLRREVISELGRGTDQEKDCSSSDKNHMDWRRRY